MQRAHFDRINRVANHPVAHIAANLYQYRHRIYQGYKYYNMVNTARRMSTYIRRRYPYRSTPRATRSIARRRQLRGRAQRVAKSRTRRTYNKIRSWQYRQQTKCHQVANQGTITGTRKLFHLAMTNIDFGDKRNDRTRNICYIKAVKLCLQFKNLRSDVLCVNYAIIVPKFGTAVNETDFFRSCGEHRGVDLSTALTSTVLSCRGINTDRFVVLMHKRLRLGSEGNDSNDINDQGSKNWAIRNHYLRVNRTVRFDSELSTTPTAFPLYFVYWSDYLCKDANQPNLSGSLSFMKTITVYFCDP